MSRRARIAGYGGAAALVVVGAVCAVVVSGGTGQVLAMAFIGVGLVVAVSLLFAEIGFSEDRERDREAGGVSAAHSRGRPAASGASRGWIAGGASAGGCRKRKTTATKSWGPGRHPKAAGGNRIWDVHQVGHGGSPESPDEARLWEVHQVRPAPVPLQSCRFAPVRPHTLHRTTTAK